ncbi:MAG: universal stress protein [Bradymonadaceae bacterium]
MQSAWTGAGRRRRPPGRGRTRDRARLPAPELGDLRARPVAPPAQSDKLEHDRKHQLDEFVEDVDLAGLSYHLHLEVSDPVDAVVETIEETGPELVVMGTHGRRGFQRLFLGSTATKVLRRMPCSVMIVRTRDEAD